MKLKPVFQALSLIFVFALVSCNEDDPASPPVLELNAANETYSLKDAKIFLRAENEAEGAPLFTYRNYIITDGEIESGGGFSIDDYSDATYFLIVQLGVPQGSDWNEGEFPQYDDWGVVPSGQNVSYLTSLFEVDLDHYYVTHDTERTPLVITGGFEPGEKISIAFTGRLLFYRLDPPTGTMLSSYSTSTLKFTGKIIDKRI